jgi:hypothetical protein
LSVLCLLIIIILISYIIIYYFIIKLLIMENHPNQNQKPGNTKGGSITVPLTSCLTGLD